MNAPARAVALDRRLTERIGRVVYWLVLVAVLISAANAIVRKLFNYSSNAYLEIQWYLFSAIFLLGARATRCCATSTSASTSSPGALSARAQNWIDIFGIVFFLLPMAIRHHVAVVAAVPRLVRAQREYRPMPAG